MIKKLKNIFLNWKMLLTAQLIFLVALVILEKGILYRVKDTEYVNNRLMMLYHDTELTPERRANIEESVLAYQQLLEQQIPLGVSMISWHLCSLCFIFCFALFCGVTRGRG